MLTSEAPGFYGIIEHGRVSSTDPESGRQAGKAESNLSETHGSKPNSARIAQAVPHLGRSCESPSLRVIVSEAGTRVCLRMTFMRLNYR
jgi:hypothetical protein